MPRKENDPSQLNLFKPQNESEPNQNNKMTSSEWEEADKLAFEMTTPGGKLIKNLTREEREAQNAEIERDINRLYAKLDLPPKKGGQAEMYFKNDKK